MNLKFLFWSFLVLFIQEQVYLQEIYSTNYTCANTLAELSCPKDYIIFVSRVEYKYTSGQCIDYDDAQAYMSSALTSDNLDDCIGVDTQNDYFTSRCNGQQNCFVEIKKKSHLTGHSGTNCDFESNMANIYYACVPSSIRDSYKRFDLCDSDGPDTILGVDSGFLHTPDFPEYYGNNHECYVNVGIPKNRRLVIYLLKMNLEGTGMFKQPKDFLQIDSLPKLYGQALVPHIVYNSSDREKVHIRFKSDWITTAKLNYPKGFLLFFSLYTINKPIASSTTTTTTTTTTPTTIQTTEEILVATLDETLNNTLLELNHKREQLVNTLREDEKDRTTFIITSLVALIGLLIVIIFGLLFMYRKRPMSHDEDLTIYVDEKSINTSHKQNETINSTQTTFSSRLRNIYDNITQTLHKSNTVLNESKCKLEDDASHLATPTKSFNVNEYQPDQCEKDIPIASLKVKDNNVRLDLERRNENPYVVNPVLDFKKTNDSDDVYTSIPEMETSDEDEMNCIYSTPTNVKVLLKNENRTNETDA